MTGRLIPTSCGPLFVREEGPARAQAVLLLHALGTDMSLWDTLATALAASRRVIRMDAPGHGHSPAWASGSMSLDALAQASWSVLDQLAAGRVDMLGSSMGAVVALRAADLAPQRVRRLVLCGAQLVRASASADEMRNRSMAIARAGMGPMADTMVERWFPPRPDGDDSAARQSVLQMMLHTSPEGYGACSDAMASYDLSGALQRLQTITLMVSGAMDGEIPHHFAELHRMFGQSRHVCMPDTGHFPHLQRPAEFLELIDDFFGSAQAD